MLAVTPIVTLPSARLQSSTKASTSPSAEGTAGLGDLARNINNLQNHGTGMEILRRHGSHVGAFGLSDICSQHKTMETPFIE